MLRSHKTAVIIAAFLTAAAASAAHAAQGDASLMLNGQSAKPGIYKPQDIDQLIISSGNVKITFAKDPVRAQLDNTRNEGGNGPKRDPAADFSAMSIIVNGTEIGKNLHGVEPRDVNARRSFYLDSYTGLDLLCDTVKVVSNTPEMAHFAVCNEANPARSPHLEHHFVMLKGENGIHPYVIISGNQQGEMRTMYKFNMDLLDYAWTNERTDKQHSYVELQAISGSGNMGDETWRIPSTGEVFTKYNYVSFYYQTPMWGHYGHNIGAWFIPTSPESYASGPLRQDLDVHQDALILNYLGGGHLSSGGTAAGLGGRPKIHGPWYLYFNTADSADGLIQDALKTSAAEKAKWPYTWVDEPTFPKNRSTVTGQLKISHNRSAANAWVILGQPGGGGRGGRGGGGGAPAGGAPAGGVNLPSALGPDLDDSANIFTAAPAGGGGGRGARGGAGGGRGAAGGGGGTEPDRATSLLSQAGDYIFFVHADDKGHFSIPGVRPGTYTLYAWQDQGPICQSLAVDNVEIKGDKVQDLGDVAWDPTYHPTLLFQIGKPDRMSGEFKFGIKREYDLLRKVPQSVDFTVGKSKESEDWYFAQNGGVWTVRFNVDKLPTGNCYVTIPIAGGGGTSTIGINGTPVGAVSKPGDGVMGRQANRAGVYGRPTPVTFPASMLRQGENTLTLQGTGMMYDTVVLEAD